MIEVTLPWPPSINHYFGYAGGRVYLKQKGRDYRKAVQEQVKLQIHDLKTINTLCKVEIEAWMPDRRKRDVDNILKALLDALTKAGVWEDDTLVDDERIYRARDENGNLLIGGMVKVRIS
jgi:crossover junction endodeoxyribonuclease RusA